MLKEKGKCKLGIRDLVIFQLESHRRCCKQFNGDPSNTILILSPNRFALQELNVKNLLLCEIMLNFCFEPSVWENWSKIQLIPLLYILP